MTNPNWPAMTFEVCFNVDPFDPSPPAAVWTSIGKVVGWNHQTPSGRQYELARTEAMAVSVQVDNQDGALDASNTSSPFWPNVLPYRQFRIKATWAATTYSLVDGYVERWPQRWDQHKAWVDLVVVDAFALLAPVMLRSCYDQEVLGDNPIAYYPLSEPETATSFGSIAPTQQPQATIVNSKYGAGTLTPGQPSIVPEEPANCVQFGGGTAGAQGSVIQLGHANGPIISGPGQPFTVDFWFQRTGALSYPEILVEQIEGNRGGAILVDYYVTMSADGKLHTLIGNAGHTAVADAATTAAYNDGKPHHVMLVWSVSGGTTTTTTLYVDGAQVLTGFVSGLFSFTGDGWIELGGMVSSGPPGNFYNGLLSHVAIYQTGLSSAQALAHYQAGATAFAGELSGARYTRILRYAGYQGPSAVDTGQSQMAAAELVGVAATQALQDVVDAELGNQYVAGDGTVTFKQRSARWNTTSVATIGEQESPYLGDIQIGFDPTFLFARVEETRPGGLTVAASDQTAQRRYGPRTLQETPQIVLDLEATDRANYQLAQYKDPKQRLPQVTLDPASNSALWPLVLGTRIGDRWTVKRRPFGAPVITFDVFVEAISHDVDFRVNDPHWRATYLLSPAGAAFQFWKLDDATFGRLDSGNLISY